MQIIKSMDELFDNLNETLQNDYPEKTLNKLSNVCRLLDERESDIINDKITLSDLLYNKYYYYCKFLNSYKKQYGTNGSMEQERFKILEDMDNRLEEAVDWELIETIEKSTN